MKKNKFIGKNGEWILDNWFDKTILIFGAVAMAIVITAVITLIILLLKW